MILNFWLDLDIVHKNLENKNKSVKLVFVYFLTFLVVFDGTKFNFFIICQYSFYYNSMSSIVNFIDYYVLQNGVICSPEQIKKEMSSALSDFLMRFQLVLWKNHLTHLDKNHIFVSKYSMTETQTYQNLKFTLKIV